jgi:hypothetical protein
MCICCVALRDFCISIVTSNFLQQELAGTNLTKTKDPSILRARTGDYMATSESAPAQQTILPTELQHLTQLTSWDIHERLGIYTSDLRLGVWSVSRLGRLGSTE